MTKMAQDDHNIMKLQLQTYYEVYSTEALLFSQSCWKQSLSMLYLTQLNMSLFSLSPSLSFSDSDSAPDRPDPHADPTLPGKGVCEEADQWDAGSHQFGGFEEGSVWRLRHWPASRQAGKTNQTPLPGSAGAEPITLGSETGCWELKYDAFWFRRLHFASILS